MLTSLAMNVKSLPINELSVVALAYEVTDADGHPQAEIEVLDPVLRKASEFIGEPWRCSCCGHGIKYACEVVHPPSNQRVCIGRDCAASIIKHQGLGNRIEGLSIALSQRGEARRLRASWLAENPQHAEIHAWAAEQPSGGIARDVWAKIARYGSISEKQIALLYRLREQAAEKAAEKAAEPVPTAPLEEGRRTVECTVLGTRTQESQYGTQYKMLVRLACANKVWLTIPSAAGDVKRGDVLKLTATFQRSQDDPHFGFGSRPKVA